MRFFTRLRQQLNHRYQRQISSGGLWLHPSNRILLIDVALFLTAFLITVTDKTDVFVYIIFILLSFGAFFWEYHSFILRIGFWLLATTAYSVRAILIGEAGVDELIEIFLLAVILIFIFLLVKQLTEAKEQVRVLNAELEKRVGELVASNTNLAVQAEELKQSQTQLIQAAIERQQLEENRLQAKLAEAANQRLEAEVAERQRVEIALRESQRTLSMLMSNLPGMAYRCRNDRDWTMEFVSEGCFELTGYSSAEFTESRTVVYTQLLDLQDQESLWQGVQVALRERQPFRMVYRLRTASGQEKWVWEQGQGVYSPTGELQAIEGFITDITERLQAEEALRESEERYALAAHGANDGLWDWNLKTDKIYYSPRWKTMLGYEEHEIGNSLEDWFSRVHPDDIKRLEVDIASHRKGLSSHFENEHRMLHKDGSYRWLLSRGLAVRDEAGNAYRITGSQTDITNRRVAEEQLLHDALHDTLTGLPNRALFMDRLGHALALAKRREDYLFAVLFLDLDRFKVVNDSLGHTVGDQLLVAIARKLEIHLRSGDTVARLGGDEFAILLDDINSINDATQVAERLHKELAIPLNLSGHEVFTNTSIGIILGKAEYNRPEDLLRDADTAMYRAKAGGKGRYEIFDEAMHDHAVALLHLETDLRRAIEGQEFELHYQPIVSLRTNKIGGFEALVRWSHPSRGLVSPADFIAVAEETGLIVPIGYWVLREACQQASIWQQKHPFNPPLTMSVNISGKQFSQPDLIERIREILQQTGMDAKNLKLEITESTIMENAESATVMLLELQALGVRLSIDDFGTGYSSLGYLNRFPIDTLKIDRSFVNSVDSDAEKMEIIRTVVTLAWNLGMDVVAEGVETTKQLAQLKALHCESGQGYLFSRPVNSETAEQLIATASESQASES